MLMLSQTVRQTAATRLLCCNRVGLRPKVTKSLRSTVTGRCVAAGQVTADADVSTVITAAVKAAGLQSSFGGNAVQQLSEHLQRNWYQTAADIAGMSKDEVQRMKIPVRLWATVRAMVAQGTAAANQPDVTNLLDTNPNTAACEQSETDLLLQQGPTSPQQQQQQQGSRAGQAVVVEVKDLATAFLDPLPDDIMQQRMPRIINSSAAGSTPVRVRYAPQAMEPYGLLPAEIPDHLQKELAGLEAFCCGVFYGQRVGPLRPVSFTSYKKELLRFLGYVHSTHGVPLGQLHLHSLLPSSSRQAVSLLMQYNHWREQERGLAPRSVPCTIKAVMALARYLYHEQSQPDAKPPYRDLEVVQELANMLRAANKAAAGAPPTADESKKWLRWEDYLGMVRALKAECAGLTSAGIPRPRRSVAESLQRYLLVAILSVVPDRQRTLRELEVGRTLIKRTDGAWVIKHSAEDYKTGKKYGERPPLVIAPFIYSELEAFINTWRQELNPKTNRLFCRAKTGLEFDEKSLYGVFKKAALRLTGKAVNPHLVRDMIVTHLRNKGTSEAEMESLAHLMAHSVKEQRQTYDRRTKAQKVEPAVELMLDLSKGAWT